MDEVIMEGRDSSVGRALDWRSKGPRFDPGSRQFFGRFHLYMRKSATWHLRRLKFYPFQMGKKGPDGIRTHDLLFTRQAL